MRQRFSRPRAMVRRISSTSRLRRGSQLLSRSRLSHIHNWISANLVDVVNQWEAEAPAEPQETSDCPPANGSAGASPSQESKGMEECSKC